MSTMTTEHTLRMLGDNVTLMRCAWIELLDELRPDSELAVRIREMLALQPISYRHCTVTYHGRPTQARRATLLPNGFWRVDLVGGLVGMYDEDPVANPNAAQRN